MVLCACLASCSDIWHAMLDNHSLARLVKACPECLAPACSLSLLLCAASPTLNCPVANITGRVVPACSLSLLLFAASHTGSTAGPCGAECTRPRSCAGTRLPCGHGAGRIPGQHLSATAAPGCSQSGGLDTHVYCPWLWDSTTLVVLLWLLHHGADYAYAISTGVCCRSVLASSGGLVVCWCHAKPSVPACSLAAVHCNEGSPTYATNPLPFSESFVYVGSQLGALAVAAGPGDTCQN